MECKRFGKGSIYEDMECMLCEKCGECNLIAKKTEKEKRVLEAHTDCKNCNEILHCKGYKIGLRCSHFIGCIDLDNYSGECDRCGCLKMCIDKSCEDVKYICTKDIFFSNIQENFFKDEVYSFKIFENKVIYKTMTLSLTDGNVFNKYFEKIHSSREIEL